MNWLDRAILAINPRAGFERLQYRAAAQIAARGYEGAKSGRLDAGWIAVGGGANATIAPAAAKIRARARDLVRNNFYGARGVRIYGANIVSTGVSLHANTGNRSANKQVDKAWAEWTAQCDADGLHNFAGLCLLAIRCTVEAGEMLVRFRPRRKADGLRVPLQLQLLEPDFLDTGRIEAGRDGNIILQGIEFDKLGRRVAYWLFDEHPGELRAFGRSSLISKRVPASEIVHLFRADRIGQIRGMSWFAPVIVKMRDYDEYSEAELVRKKVNACFGPIITTPEGAAASPLAPVGKDRAGNRTEALQPGMMVRLNSGENVQFPTPPADTSMRDYASISAHEIATGLDVTYEDLTGDLSQVNYSSYRAGRLIHRRVVEQFQWATFAPMFLMPIRRRFLDAGFLAGAFGNVADDPKITFPKWESIDPLKDAMADRAKIRMGTLTLRQAIAGEGEDPDAQIEEIKETNAKLDAAGIVLDCDPRKVTDKGQAQGAAPTDPNADPATAETANAGATGT